MEEENVQPERSKRKGLRILLVSILVLMPVVYFGVNNIAIAIDGQEKIPHANCEVLSKDEVASNGLYLIKTSCGDYEAAANMNGFLKVGTDYDMEVTKGNWARKPHLSFADGCSKPSLPLTPDPKPSPSPVPTKTPPAFSNGNGKDA